MGLFAIYIKKLEGDELLLSTAYLKYQQLKMHVQNDTDLPKIVCDEIESFGSSGWQNFLYNPAVIVVYKLDPRYYYSNYLNACIFDSIIEKKIIQLAEEYKDIVLIELAEYVGKTEGFTYSYLWEDII